MATNRRYTVTVAIDVDADDPLSAAQNGFDEIMKSGDIFTYEVTDDQNQKFEVNLLTEKVATT